MSVTPSPVLREIVIRGVCSMVFAIQCRFLLAVSPPVAVTLRWSCLLVAFLLVAWLATLERKRWEDVIRWGVKMAQLSLFAAITLLVFGPVATARSAWVLAAGASGALGGIAVAGDPDRLVSLRLKAKRQRRDATPWHRAGWLAGMLTLTAGVHYLRSEHLAGLVDGLGVVAIAATLVVILREKWPTSR